MMTILINAGWVVVLSTAALLVCHLLAVVVAGGIWLVQHWRSSVFRFVVLSLAMAFAVATSYVTWATYRLQTAHETRIIEMNERIIKQGPPRCVNVGTELPEPCD